MYVSGHTKEEQEKFMQRAFEVALNGMLQKKGGPFGCVIVKDGEIIGEGCNQVTSSNDPTAHAEIVAIRNACKSLNTFQLDGCEIYTTCEPCPMCLGAIYWARPKVIYFGNTRSEAAKIGFDDQMIYDEIPLPHASRSLPIHQLRVSQTALLFSQWEELKDKKKY
ncbi:MAG: nucleoside deaminase [Crocinitomicaceae bacterium]|nr:nucleoside deaminase [Crocinitomicaceae bacterium]